jgi:hypothetical protein
MSYFNSNRYAISAQHPYSHTTASDRKPSSFPEVAYLANVLP